MANLVSSTDPIPTQLTMISYGQRKVNLGTDYARDRWTFLLSGRGW